jgi:hypothetical protein
MTLKYETWLYWLLLLDDFINCDIFLGIDGLKLVLLMYLSLPPIGLCTVQAQDSITATTLLFWSTLLVCKLLSSFG